MERLGLLIDERCGGSKTAFGELVGVGTTHVTLWRDRGVIPGGSKLLAIARAAGVSVDWLLGFDVPRYRDESRSLAELETDLAHFVARNVRAALTTAMPSLEASMIQVDATRLLVESVRAGAEACVMQRKAMLAYTVLARSVAGASLDLFAVAEAFASTIEPQLQAGLGRAVGEQRRTQEVAATQLAKLSGIVVGDHSVRLKPEALIEDVGSPTMHVLEWMSHAEPDGSRSYDTDEFLTAAGQPTSREIGVQMGSRAVER